MPSPRRAAWLRAMWPRCLRSSTSDAEINGSRSTEISSRRRRSCRCAQQRSCTSLASFSIAQTLPESAVTRTVEAGSAKSRRADGPSATGSCSTVAPMPFAKCRPAPAPRRCRHRRYRARSEGACSRPARRAACADRPLLQDRAAGGLPQMPPSTTFAYSDEPKAVSSAAAAASVASGSSATRGSGSTQEAGIG